MTLDDYAGIAGASDIRAIKAMAEKLKGKTLLHVNSTPAGGGVAELLQRMVPLTKGLGIDAKWSVIKGTKQFFEATKRLHNALQGREKTLTGRMWDIYETINRRNAGRINLDADCVFIHDPQPAMLIEKKERGVWIWRCHIDISEPERAVWRFLRDFVERYDAAVFSASNFAQAVSIPQFMITPSIDPLSEKNMELSSDEIKGVFDRFAIAMDKPILLQVSRFDPFKDPVGVIEAYRLIKKYHDCRLVLAGGTAKDDPEGGRVLEEVREKAGDDPDIHILLLPLFSDREVNALQRGATIVLQKSLKEGFGLAVAESLWKGKPVIGGNAGGIPLQIIEGVTGFLVNSIEGTAYRIRQLLVNPAEAQRMGEAGREHVRINFLITKHIKRYLAIWIAMENKDKKVIYL